MTMEPKKRDFASDNDVKKQNAYLLTPEKVMNFAQNRVVRDHNHHNYIPLRNDDSRTNDENVKNVDDFLKNMYRFYSEGGLWAIILSKFCGLVSLTFTIGFSVTFVAFIDWNAVLDCKDELSCQNLHSSLFANNLYPLHSQNPNIFGFLTISYLILSSSYYLYQLFSAINIISYSVEMEKFYREVLGISSKDITNFQWFEVVDRLIYLSNCGALKSTIFQNIKINPHNIVLRIMRKENYMIGLINKNLLGLFIPWWMSPFMSEKLFLTKSLEWSLQFCLMDFMFTEQDEITDEFLNDIQGLKLR